MPTVLIIGLALAADVGPLSGGSSATAQTTARKARVRKERAAGKGDPRNVPPACPREGRATAQAHPPRSMGDMMERMAQRFATDPANGFTHVLDDLAALEGPALEGVSLSPVEERRIGSRAREEYLGRARAQGYAEVHDRRRLDYLQALVDRTARRMTHRERYPDIGVTLIEAPVSDGQAFPGGSLVFTTALLDEPDEATVVGVVAHELAHLDRGHMYDAARREKLAREGFGPSPGGVGSLDTMFTRQAALFGMLMRPFRPEQEHEADCTASTWMYQEGYDPTALMAFFDRLHRRRNDEPGAAVPFFNFARSHPYSLDRRDHVRARLRQLQAWRPRGDLGLFAENLRTRQPRPDAAADGGAPAGK